VTTHFFIAIAYLAWLTLAGAGLMALFDKGKQRLFAENWIPSGLALGLGLQSTVLALALLCSRRLEYGWPWAAEGLAVAGLVVAMVALKRPRLGGLQCASLLGRASRATSVEACCLGALLFLLWLAMGDALRYPIMGYDGMAIWNFKAKILFREGTPWTDAFTDPFRVHYHRNYPLLFPLALTTLYRAMGVVDEHAVKALYFALFLGMVAACHGRLVARTGKPTVGVLAALLTAGLPLWQFADHGVFSSGYADLAMTLPSFLALAELDDWWRSGERSSLARAAIFAGLCLQTKNEGLLLLAAMLGAGALQAAAFKRHRNWRTLAALSAFAAAALVVALPSVLVTRQLPNFYDEDYVGMLRADRVSVVIARLPSVFANFKEIALDREAWGRFWLLYPIVAVLGLPRRLREGNAFADAAIFMFLACVLAVFSLTTLHVDFHMKTALPRLLMQIYPFAVYRMGCQAAEAWDAIQSPRAAMPEATPGGRGWIGQG
jgi:hypothetical protein